jgi:uncharacterized protein YggU (UPF0235/DUF167 family)
VLLLTVKVKPGSKNPGFSIENRQLVLRVRERAIDGAANQACIRMLSNALGVPPSRIELKQGARGREKRFAVDGIDEALARRRLGLDEGSGV